MRILFIGDIVGPPGVTFVQAGAAGAGRRARGSTCVIANAENAAGGSGLTPSLYRKLREAGVDLVTLGDHIYKKQEIIADAGEGRAHLQAGQLSRPTRRAASSPWPRRATARRSPRSACWAGPSCGRSIVPSGPPTACWQALAGAGARASSWTCTPRRRPTSTCMGHHLKGRVSAVLGTHTHVPTADEQILPGGTAFISDVGMTGPYDSILGRRIDRVLSTTITFVPSAFDVATGDPRLAGAVVDVDPATGQATAIRRLMVRDGDCS